MLPRTLITVLVLLGTRVLATDNDSSPEYRGVCFVAGPRGFDEKAFAALTALNVNWISVSPFGWMQSTSDPEVVLRTGGRVWWGESDEGLRATFRAARKHGIKTLLSPHIWMRPGETGEWRGALAFAAEEDWQTWERDYRAFIHHYARLAAEEGVEAFCIGAELRTAVSNRPAFWRSLIHELREVYDGRLTYAANWYEEFEEVAFWDALDFIGIQAYFPLQEKGAGPSSLESLMAGWSSHAAKIEALQKRVGKRVVFTEVGYRSTSDAPTEPWQWGSDGAVDTGVQAACYEAMFRTVWHRPWFEGIFIWKWYPYDERRPGRRERDFTPQGKTAEKVMGRWFGGEWR